MSPGEHVPDVSIYVVTDTYQFPGVADVVGVFAVVPESVGVPGQRGVHWHTDDLTAQREAAKYTQH